jgi:hypothetical protein
VTYKPSEANKSNLEDKSKKPTNKKLEKVRLKSNLNKPPKSKRKIGDLFEI